MIYPILSHSIRMSTDNHQFRNKGLSAPCVHNIEKIDNGKTMVIDRYDEMSQIMINI